MAGTSILDGRGLVQYQKFFQLVLHPFLGNQVGLQHGGISNLRATQLRTWFPCRGHSGKLWVGS
jgi:hypothetical protein